MNFCKNLDENLSKCIQKVGIVRYSAFKDTGSDLSFAAALLDEDNNGIVFNGIYSREMSNIYAKPVENGKSKYTISEEEMEAIEKAVELKKGSMVYPVHYSKSNTSGEKEYEEFFTNQENVDMKRFDSLGVITDKRIPDKDKAHNILTELDEAFERTMLTKDDVVQIIKRYLPEFEHIEKGRSLDSKM